MPLKYPIIGVDIFFEKRKTRLYTGTLIKKNNQFIFTYDRSFIDNKNTIPLGPEFPMTKLQFKSRKLFPSFEDRYSDYCRAMGIDPSEKEPLAIARRGLSSFIFTPKYERSFTIDDVVEFRQKLNLTTREFAEVFEITQSSLNGLECKRISGKDILKKLELIVRFPEVAEYLLILNGAMLSNEKWNHARKMLY